MGKGNYRASDEGLGVGVECLTIHYDGEVWELSSFAFYKYEQCYYKKLMMAEDERFPYNIHSILLGRHLHIHFSFGDWY